MERDPFTFLNFFSQLSDFFLFLFHQIARDDFEPQMSLASW